jgi:hypothetical protein
VLDVRDLLALRLVSRKTSDWVDAVMPNHPSKAFTLYVNESRAQLDELMDEEIAHTPFFRRLNVRDSSFFSHPRIPEFLGIYGGQIHTVYRSKEDSDVAPEELAFYEALTNLTQLSTGWLGDNVPDLKMPALQRLQLHTIPLELSARAAKINFDFLLNFPNLIHFWLPRTNIHQYLEVLIALGPYFAIRNGLEGSCRRTLTIFLLPYGTFPEELSPSEKEKVAELLQELAVADGRILIESMPITLLDKAVLHFCNQPGKLRSFGKCIRSLRGFSSSLYEVELPNMRKINVDHDLLFKGKESDDGNYSKAVNSWPKLEEFKSNIMRNEHLAKLVFWSGVFRSSVKRLDCDLKLLFLDSIVAHMGLGNFPNLTHLTLSCKPDEVGFFRSLMRVLPTSCPNIQLLHLNAQFCLRDEDFLGVEGEDGLLHTPPLLQFPGK